MFILLKKILFFFIKRNNEINMKKSFSFYWEEV